MEPRSELIVEVSLRPTDVYDPFMWSWQNLVRWVIVVFVCLLIYDNRSKVAPPLLLLAAGITCVALFLYPYLRLRSMIRNSPGFRIPRRLFIDSDGLRLESENARGDYKWSFFKRIIESPKSFLFLQTTYSATYIPKRCLTGSDDVASLRQLIRANFRGKFTLRND